MTAPRPNPPDPGPHPVRGAALAFALLRRCAPRDADVAIEDLTEERRRSAASGQGRVPGAVRFWLGVAGVCAYALRDRTVTSFGRPAHALRLAARGLARSPGTALTAAATLAVGMAATVSLLGVYAGGRRDLPVPEGEEIVAVSVLDARSQPTAPPSDVLTRWSHAPALEGVAAVRTFEATVIHEGGPAFRVGGAEVSPGLIELLGVPPALGRPPTADPGDTRALLVGWEVWQRELGADPAIVGATVRMDGRPWTIVGVMPERFGFPLNESLWRTMPLSEGLPAGSQIVGRLADGATPEGATAALAATLAGAEATGSPGPLRVRVRPWVSGRGEGGEAVAFAGLGVLAGLLLLVCAANVSTLLLVRATERASTIAVQAALGAPRGQVVVQLLFESLLVALGGGVLGLAAGQGVLRWMEANLSQHWGYYWMEMGVEPRVVLGTLVAVIVAAVLAGTAPATIALRADLREVLGNQPGGARHRQGFARWFVGAQVAFSTVGLVAAVVLGRGFLRSDDLVEGLPLDGVAVASLLSDSARYPTPEARRALALELREALSSRPGVASASVSSGLPVLGGGTATLRLSGPAGEETTRVTWLAGDAGFTDTFGMDLLAGRSLGDADVVGAPPVVLVNRPFARRWLGGRGLGATLRLEGVHDGEAWATVVGVVDDHLPERRGSRVERVIVPLGQTDPGAMWISVARGEAGGPSGRTSVPDSGAGRGSGGAAELARGTAAETETLVSALRSAAAAVDPALALEQVRTLRGLTDWLLRMPRVMAGFGALGGLAGVVVVAIGLYGVIAFQVRVRMPELGVRMALGAGAARVAGRVVRLGLVTVAPGLAVGLAVGFAIVPPLDLFAFGTGSRPPEVLGVVAAGMLAVAVLSALGPALRAARVDPGRVARAD